jgi:hypothetical protein
MSFDALRETLEQRMADNWSDSDVAYENIAFSPPSPSSSAKWVRFTVINGESRTSEGGITSGNYKTRDTGLVSLQIFVPQNSGTKKSRQLIDSFNSIFEHKRFSGVVTYSASIVPVGVLDGWHQTNLTIPFRRIRNV